MAKISFIVASIIGVGFGLFHLRSLTEDKINSLKLSLTNNYETHIDYDDLSFGIGKAVIKNFHSTGKFRIKAKTISAGISFSFQELPKLSIELSKCIIRIPLPSGSTTKIKQSPGNAKGSVMAFARQYLGSIKAKNCILQMVDSKGNPIYEGRFRFWELDLADQDLFMNVKELLYKKKPIVQKFEARVILSKKSSNSFPFLISSKNRHPYHWQAKGRLHLKEKKIDIFFKNSGLPQAWKDVLGQKLEIDSNVNYAMSLKAQYDNEVINFQYHAASTNLSLFHSKLSNKTIGPMAIKLKASGFFEASRDILVVENGEFILLSPKNRAKRIHTYFEVSNQNLLSKKPRWQFQVSIPNTSCQTILDVVPENFFPQLTNFSATGSVQASFKVSMETLEPHKFKVSDNNSSFHCRFDSHSRIFTRELLVERRFLKDLDNHLPSPQMYSLFSSQFTSQISPYLPIAIVANEDNRFFKHRGVDWEALEAAIRVNLKKGEFKVGASTLTMQLSKNLFFSPAKTFSRKLQEIAVSLYLESILNKDEILNTYMNVVEFGPSIFGIKRASNLFFNKDPLDLTLKESAYLASILPSPRPAFQQYCQGFLDQPQSYKTHKTLERMRSIGKITNKEFQSALGEPIMFRQVPEELRKCRPNITKQLNPKATRQIYSHLNSKDQRIE